LIEKLAANVPDGPVRVDLPEKLPANKHSVGIVEAFRGELIHLCITGANGEIRRYAIKDPSFNNWTAISVGIRDNLVADFPMCNKSLALSYGGNDL
jgi:Ni,Fe-hydrogenase III large subunit